MSHETSLGKALQKKNKACCNVIPVIDIVASLQLMGCTEFRERMLEFVEKRIYM